MNTINNKRKRESQKRIEKIFVELIQDKDINEISVSEICKLASINRTTFYNNYIDIYDLAEKIKEKLELDVKDLYKEERLNRYNSNDFSKIFGLIKENQLFFKTFFKLGFDTNDMFNENYTYDTKLAEYFYDGKFIDYHIEFFKAGFNAIVKKWLNGGCKESIDEINEILITEYRQKR